MSSVSIICGYRAGGGAPVMRTNLPESQSQDLNASASSQQGTPVALEGQFWEISPIDTVWVTFGTNPTAAAGTTFKVWGGSTRHFQAKAGDKVAVVNA